MKISNFLSKKYIYIALWLIITILVGISWVLAFEVYKENKVQKKLDALESVITTSDYSRDNCMIVLDFDVGSITNNQFLPIRDDFRNFKLGCEKVFDISLQEQTQEFCERVIKWTEKSFTEDFILIDTFSQIQKQCTTKFLSVTFSTGSLFDIENNFKSSIAVDFASEFYEDLAEDDVNFIEHRTKAKQRFIDLLDISPSVEISVDDVVLYPKSGILFLDLEPETEYSFSLKDYDSAIEWESMRVEDFILMTPKNTYFGLKQLEKVSLFRDSDKTEFELISYDTDKTQTKIKICRISNENYAKIEAFREQESMWEVRKDFFMSWIDEVDAYMCDEKLVALGESETPLKRTTFDFSDIIGEQARSGLYYVTFAESEERFYNERLQEPLFFGIVDSHITMKVSKNGKAFFFVNDLDGNPLSGQKLRAYINDSPSLERKWNGPERKYDVTYNNPLENSILGEAIALWTTNSEGILEVDLKGKIDGAFEKTFESWDFDWNGNYNSFFITSASDTHLSYISSKWNWGIAAWNFGYTTWWGWWYGDSQNMDAIELNRWGREEPSMYSHTYSDRKLYLPGEKVYIKSVLRNSEDLSISSGQEIRIKVLDPKWKELSETTKTINDYGSISETIELSEQALLWNYRIYVYSGDETIGQSWFSVEIFKNPKFKNEVMLQTTGLNNQLVSDVQVEQSKTSWGYTRNSYTSDFTIKASVSSQYYSWAPVKNTAFTYKVYKQRYYDNNYWSGCYYGCYWQAEKEFYTEWTGKLDENWLSNLEIPVEFESRYNDYKYIVEITVTDNAGDTISGSNSIIAKLPEQYKWWNPDSGLEFVTQKRFYQAGETFKIEGQLTWGDFSAEYNDQFIFIVKKKHYSTNYVKDVRGYDRPVTQTSEKVEQIILVNDTNFTIKDGKVSLNYTLPESGEYVFEFGKVNDAFFELWNGDNNKKESFEKIIEEFNTEKSESVDIWVQKITEMTRDWSIINYLVKTCVWEADVCSRIAIRDALVCITDEKWLISDEHNFNDCNKKINHFEIQQKLTVNDLIDYDSKKYFTLIWYDDSEASNPIQSDNKITVLSEKVSYKLWDTARILVRLPFSRGKILWTIEKQGVLKHEYIDVPGNTFFKEIEIDDTFVPNAYIWVVVVDTNSEKVPEYKVGYTEIVVDKSDKKSDITIVSDKTTYEPRETVTLDIAVKDMDNKNAPSELTVMVVDDSLISLMWNIDSNAIDKFYKKLPFQIQTSITNIAMLKNYYFSRKWIVGWSGFGNFKGWDSAVSSRNIFKNTAYYNPSVVTDVSWKARVSFDLPDNLTNFRVMVLSNSKDNLFWYAESFIEVRKDVIVEDRTPLILREWDEIVLGANVFNTTSADIGFKSILQADGLEISEKEKQTTIPAGESRFISWKVKNTLSCGYLDIKCEIPYMISVLWDSAKHSDKLEGIIILKSVPALETNTLSSQTLPEWETADLTLTLPENTNIEKSTYSISLSNNPLLWISKIIKSLAVYPFGCGEQLLSSTMPNAVVKRFTGLVSDTGVDTANIDSNIEAGLAKIYDMALDNGAFKYWYNDTNGNVHITAYGVRVLSEIQNSWTDIDTSILEKAIAYLTEKYKKSEGIEKAESLWAVASYHGRDTESVLAVDNLSLGYDTDTMQRHELIAFTYGLVLADSDKYKTLIDSNIQKISTLLDGSQQGSYYYSKLSDMWEFTQMLMSYDSKNTKISEYIAKLYEQDWESYWYSTKTKNNAFLAFAQYIEIYGQDSLNTLDITLNDRSDRVYLGKDGNSYKVDVELTDVLQDNKVALSVKNVSGNVLFASANIKAYPEDPMKIKNFSQWVKLTREIYEVVDANNISEKCSWNNGDRTCSEDTGLEKVTGDIFKKWATYKIVLDARFDEYNRRQNLTMEDYIPAGFTILNSNFNTNSIATNQETTNNSWRWSHVEKRPEVVMVHSKNSWGTTARYEYFVRADFTWEFVYPPAVVYLMYQPETRANSVFKRIVIK